MASIEKVDTDIALALKFFGIEPEDMSKAKDIKWLEKQNIIHQLNNDKRQLSNQYFAVLKQNQHRLDFVGTQLNKIQLIDEKVSTEPAKTNWFDKDYKEVQKKQEDDQQILAFKESIERAFMTVSIKDGELNSRADNFNKPGSYQNQNTQNYNSAPMYNNTNRDRADSACIVGAWLSVISGVIFMIMSFDWWYIDTYSYWTGHQEVFSIFGPIMTVMAIWTVSENWKIINRTAKSKTAGGVLGLIFGFFIGGLITLCGRYDEDY